LTEPAKVPLDAPDGALDHGADLARLQVPEPLPAQLAALLVPGAIERDQVQVRVDGAPSWASRRRHGNGNVNTHWRNPLCGGSVLPIMPS